MMNEKYKGRGSSYASCIETDKFDYEYMNSNILFWAKNEKWK